jgi:hypothetical protein
VQYTAIDNSNVEIQDSRLQEFAIGKTDLSLLGSAHGSASSNPLLLSCFKALV